VAKTTQLTRFAQLRPRYLTPQHQLESLFRPRQFPGLIAATNWPALFMDLYVTVVSQLSLARSALAGQLKAAIQRRDAFSRVPASARRRSP
jgi:hypothetical protein